MPKITYDEAVNAYNDIMITARSAGVRPELYLQRTCEGVEFIGRAPRGNARHNFGFSELYLSESDADKLRREYFIELKEYKVKYTYEYL